MWSSRAIGGLIATRLSVTTADAQPRLVLGFEPSGLLAWQGDADLFPALIVDWQLTDRLG